MSLLTYVWHYTVARLLYDDLVAPLGPASLVIAGLVAAALLVRRRDTRAAGGRRWGTRIASARRRRRRR